MPTVRTELGALDLNLLHALVALVEERSTTAAARRLGLAQSTVSGTLARLRETFGDDLLVREGRGLAPTARALELLEAIRPHLDGLVAAVGAVVPFDPATDARTFRLGCTDAVALSVLPRLTEGLRRDAPGCALVVRIGDYRGLPGMMAGGEVATVLGYLRDDPSATAKMRVMRRSPWVVLRDSAQAPLDGVADFCARPHALVTPAGDLSGVVDGRLAEKGMARRVGLGVTSFALLPSALRGTDLVATVPDFVGAALAALGGLAVDPCPVEVAPVVNTLAWRATADADPAERWFRARLAEAFAAG